MDILNGPKGDIHVSLPQAMIDALREKAQKEDRAISWIVKRALAEYLTEGVSGGFGVKPVAPGQTSRTITFPYPRTPADIERITAQLQALLPMDEEGK